MVIRKPVALWLMKRLVFTDKKLLIPAIVITGLIATCLVATPVLAVIGQKIGGNSTTSMFSGSVNVADAIKNFTKDNQKVPFSAASATAEKQIANGRVLGGHIGIAQGYLVYTFFVVNPENQTGYKVIVDPGNGQVLYTSEGRTIDHGGPGMFGHGGDKWMRHGSNWFGGSGDERGPATNLWTVLHVISSDIAPSSYRITKGSN